MTKDAAWSRREMVWLGGHVVLVDVEGCTICYEELCEQLARLPQAKWTEGPLITGIIAVTFEVGPLDADALVALALEVQKKASGREESCAENQT